MKKYLLIAASLLLCLPLAAAVQKVSLNSDGRVAAWQLRAQDEVTDVKAMLGAGYDASGWVAAVVPGAAFTSFVEAGIESDPNFGDNAYKVDRCKYDRNFWYRAEFATKDLPAGARRWICFEGVNRGAEVYFNGARLGSLDGFMDRGMFEVTHLLRQDAAPNVLAVLVRVPTNPIANHASPTYISSAGWDWMPYVPGLLGGITDDVYFTTSGDVSLVDPWVRTRVPSREQGVISLTTELKNHSQQEKTGVVRGVIRPGDITFEKRFKIGAGQQRTVGVDPREFPQLTVDDPALWWPNGYGDQNLYTCELTCEVDGEVSDRRTVTFGIREYSYDFVKGVFQLSVNGERIYCKGGNWGMSEYMLRCRGAEYDLKIRLHREMNYNMIRNWIGSTTDDEFYEACDRYGIMVFDDFWLNSHPNLPDDVFAFNRNAVEKIKRLRNHPSIAVWCGDNEGVPLAPLNEWLREDVKAFDGGDRWYQPISREYGFSGSGPWVNAHPIWYFTAHPLGYGDHKLDGWGFRTEIGSAVFTNYESYKKFMPEPERWPASPEMLDKHFFGNSAGNARPTRYFAAVEYNYGKAAGTEDFCRKAQLLNLEVNKAMYEGWQHHMWDDATGIMTWMSQPAYPSLVWQTYDYYLDPTGAYWGIRKACEPVHIQWSHADNSVKAVNTTREPLEATATARVYDLDGRLLPQFTQQLRVSLAANTTRSLFDLNFSEGNLARNRPVKASSSSPDGAGTGALTDGNDSSRWASEYSDDQWIEVDLGERRAFTEVVLRWEDAHAAAYKLQLSDDGRTWRDVYETQDAQGGEQTIPLPLQQARYVRMLGLRRATQWGYSLYEMEVYRRDAKAPKLSPVHFIRLELTDRDGRLLSDNFYWRATRRGDYTALNTLAPAKLQVRSQLTAAGGRKVIRTTVRNVGRSVAFAVHVQPYRRSDGERILPYVADDNYFTLLQGESRQIDFEFDAGLLPDDRYTVRAEAYNR